MSDRIVVRSGDDNHVLFSCFKAYYPHASVGERNYYPHCHTELEISSILSGSGIYSCAGVDYPFQAGDVFFHCGNDIHYFKSLKGDVKPALVVIRFDSRFIWSPSGEWFNSKYLKLFMQSELIRRQIPKTTPMADVITQLLTEIFEECERQDPAYDLLIKAKLMTILANMARYFNQELEQSREPIVSELRLAEMERSMKYILSHLDSPLTLDVLAKEACMSRSYYSTMFKTLNGVSVWDYITGQRINLAQYQLETTDKTVMDISVNCGFNSIANFNRAFKRLTGKTPREYRRSAPRVLHTHTAINSTASNRMEAGL